MSNNFKQKILVVVGMIPREETMSYKRVAELAGRPKAYRAVGNILVKNYDREFHVTGLCIVMGE